MSTVLRFSQVTFSREGVDLFRDLSFEVPKGSCIALLGQNGIGKTTLLRLAAGTLNPNSGSIELGDTKTQLLERKERARRVALVPQHVEVPFDFTVEQMVAQARTPYLSFFGRLGPADREAVEQALTLTDTAVLRQRIFNQLSGGERQRVKVALGLAQQAELLLLDEPTQSLDIGRQLEVLELVRSLNKKGVTILAAMHDLQHIASYFTNVFLLGKAGAFMEGKPKDILTPAILEYAFHYRSPLRAEVVLDRISESADDEQLPALLAETVRAIVPLHADDLAEARIHLDALTKPIGSLGRLEDFAAQLSAVFAPLPLTAPLRKAAYVFAADHGITAARVSAYPREVTGQMVHNYLRGGAAVNVIASQHGVDLRVVDVGVDADFEEAAGLYRAKVRRGTYSFIEQPAMGHEDVLAAIQVGLRLASLSHELGHQLIAIGEMGIGNTTAASAITCALTGQPADRVTGLGTGVDEARRQHKIEIIDAAIRLHFGDARVRATPLEILRCVGGLEIAAMMGFMLGASRLRLAVVCDGLIATAAAALAFAIAPAVKGYLFAGHCSEEPGHLYLLNYIGLTPILSLGMRLGEASGAVLAMPVLESAVRIYIEMATFASAGVSEASV